MAVNRFNRRRGMIVTGQEQVIKNLNKEVQAIKGRSLGGMSAAALLVKGESMERTPVEFANLKNEHYIDVYTDTGGGISAEIGTGTHVSQDYALYVHENLDSKHTVGQARFLATALIVKARDVFAILKAWATIK